MYLDTLRSPDGHPYTQTVKSGDDGFGRTLRTDDYVLRPDATPDRYYSPLIDDTSEFARYGVTLSFDHLVEAMCSAGKFLGWKITCELNSVRAVIHVVIPGSMIRRMAPAFQDLNSLYGHGDWVTVYFGDDGSSFSEEEVKNLVPLEYVLHMLG